MGALGADFIGAPGCVASNETRTHHRVRNTGVRDEGVQSTMCGKRLGGSARVCGEQIGVNLSGSVYRGTPPACALEAWGCSPHARG